MKILDCLQRSPEWWEAKIGKIGGTRFGKVISNRKNRLVYEIMNEILSGQCSIDEFISDDMQYGIDNELEAIELYQKISGVKLVQVGMIISDRNDRHIASPDSLSDDYSIVAEVKCTMNGDIHLQRFFDGVDTNYIPQCVNYFAVSPKIKEVHFISFCGYRTERPCFYKVLKRDTYTQMIETGIKKIDETIEEVNDKLEQYSF